MGAAVSPPRTCDDPVHRARSLRTAGLLAIAGGLGYFAVLVLHGDLPDETAAVAMEHVAARPEWPLLKLSLIAFVFCWVGAFALAARTMSGGAGTVATLASAFVTVAATLVLIEYSVLGHGFKNVADAWAASAPAERQQHLLVGEALLGVSGGLFLNFITWLIGLPFMLLGLSIAIGGEYPRWMGWLAVAAGAGAFVAGVTRFLGVPLIPFPVLYGAFIVPLCLWLAGLGALMYRRAGAMAGGQPGET